MKLSKLNIVFISELAVFTMVILDILPRETVIYLTAALAVYVIIANLEDATIFFIRSIPFFLAIPLTSTFDNFNAWRILSVIIFLKWTWLEYQNLNIKNQNYTSKVKNYGFKIPLLGLLVFALLSVIPAGDKILAIKRIIYFINLSLIGFVIYDLAKNSDFAKRLIRNITIPIIAVALVGFLQVISTYFVDIYQFMRIWGEGIQCRQFGEQWCNIAVQVGNTWFAYYGEQLSLRVFSLFPDSHSFPQFLLLGLPAIFAVFWTRKKQLVTWVSLIFLATILSGTRGIWAASIGVILSVSFYALLLTWQGEIGHRRTLLRIFSYLGIFFILFVVAFPIFQSPQFLVSKGDSDLFKKRVRSIIDFGETSNSQRIQIWKDSLRSIKDHPILGVGIGNFPVVLNQKLELARAGSSAHNIYLHIAAEMGIPALILALWFIWLLLKRLYSNFISDHDSILATYYGATLLFIPWILIYSLTDVALFDERAFLIFVITVSLVLIKKPLKAA